MDLLNLPSVQEIIILLPAVIIGLTFHEAAHGYAAYNLGDYTAKDSGRLTINPLKHIDPVGMILLFLVGFGWAKPVPVNPMNFQGDRRKGMLKVALAGPVSNVIMAVLFSVVLGLLLGFGVLNGDSTFSYYALNIVYQLVSINIVLAVFNLLPVPPLDGSKVFASLFPQKSGWVYGMEKYGTIILLILLLTGVLGKLLFYLIDPMRSGLLSLAYGLASLIQGI